MRHALPTLLLAAVVSACAGGDDAPSTDTMAAGTAAGGTVATDTAAQGMVGMNHGTMGRAAARDSNQSFLRMMSDHHQGLIALADTASAKVGATAKADAQKLRTDQKAEQDHMLHLLGTQYQDSVTPTIMPSNQQMIQAVAAAPAGQADRAFYQQVIAHHREGVQMIDRMLPSLTGEVKAMATKAREKQQGEIAMLEKKAG